MLVLLFETEKNWWDYFVFYVATSQVKNGYKKLCIPFEFLREKSKLWNSQSF